MAKNRQSAERETTTPMQWLSQLYLGLLAVILVLYPGTDGYEAIDQAKHSCVMVLGGGYVALCLLLWVQWILTDEKKPDWSAWKRSGWSQRLVVAYLLLTLLAAALSPYPETWKGMSRGEGFWTICIYGLSFLLLSIHGSFRPWVVHVFGAAMTLTNLVAVLQLLGQNPLGLYPDGLTYFDAGTAYSGEYLGLTGNADVTSALLTLAIPLLAGYLWYGKEKSRIWLAVPLSLSVLVLLWSKVAAGYVALLAGLAVTIPVLFPKKRQRAAAWYAVIGAGAAAVLTLFLWEPSGGTLREFHLLLHGESSGSFGSGRLHIWKQVLALAADNLWFGTGPDTLLAAKLEGFTRYDENLNMLLVAQIDLAHNEYLNILVSQGLPALLIYLGALGVTLMGWWKQARSNPLIAVCGAAVIWYSIQIFFGFSLCATAPLFWAIWALAERECRKGRTKA